ncbi:MAG: toll/interleukin-1 receptor domain-containing protein [Ktedonobacterales bacterium]
MSGIFISYRREDTAETCGRLYTDLVAFFGQEYVFKDVYNIITGKDFADQLRQSIPQCDVLLAVIGPKWIGPFGKTSTYTTMEIELARQHGIPIIPVLAQSVKMSGHDQLPPNLAFLAMLDGAMVRVDPDYPWDVQRLIQKILVLAPQLTPRFDAQAALARAKQGNLPPDWTAWRLSRGSSVGRGFQWFYTSALLTMVVGIFSTVLVSIAGGGGTASDMGGRAVAALAAAFAAAMGIGLLAGLIGLVTGSSDQGRAALVLTPNGVVQFVSGMVASIDFTTAESINLQIQGLPIAPTASNPFYKPVASLLVLTRDGRTTKWKLDLRFGRPETIAQAVIAAHTRYVQSRRAFGVAQPAPYQAGVSTH